MGHRTITGAVAALLCCVAAGTSAHGPETAAHDGPSHEMAAGMRVPVGPHLRVIAIDMDDTLRYRPSRVWVHRGEAVRIVATNHGKALHEIVIGTRAELEAHARAMREH